MNTPKKSPRIPVQLTAELVRESSIVRLRTEVRAGVKQKVIENPVGEG